MPWICNIHPPPFFNPHSSAGSPNSRPCPCPLPPRHQSSANHMLWCPQGDSLPLMPGDSTLSSPCYTRILPHLGATCPLHHQPLQPFPMATTGAQADNHNQQTRSYTEAKLLPLPASFTNTANDSGNNFQVSAASLQVCPNPAQPPGHDIKHTTCGHRGYALGTSLDPASVG